MFATLGWRWVSYISVLDGGLPQPREEPGPHRLPAAGLWHRGPCGPRSIGPSLRRWHGLSALMPQTGVPLC